MDWSKLKSTLGSALPAVASVIGTPLAGAAVKTICNALGLKDDSSPSEIEAAYLNASPEQLTKLKEIDANERIRMEEIAAYDRNSAREREKAVKDNTIKILAYGTSLAFFGIIFFTASKYIDITGAEKDIFCILIGQLSMKFGSIIDYYFGSSSSSRKKDELLAERIRNA